MPGYVVTPRTRPLQGCKAVPSNLIFPLSLARMQPSRQTSGCTGQGRAGNPTCIHYMYSGSCSTGTCTCAYIDGASQHDLHVFRTASSHYARHMACPHDQVASVNRHLLEEVAASFIKVSYVWFFRDIAQWLHLPIDAHT